MGKTRARHAARPDALGRQKERARRRRRLRKARRRREVGSARDFGGSGLGSCGRKVRFSTRQGAEAWAAGTEARYGHGSRPQVPYRCGLCGGWHLTSHPRARAQEPILGTVSEDVGD